MEIETINGFKLPSKKISIEQYAGYLSRSAYVSIKFKENNDEQKVNKNKNKDEQKANKIKDEQKAKIKVEQKENENMDDEQKANKIKDEQKAKIKVEQKENEQLLDCKCANNLFMSWVSKNLNENEIQQLNNYRSKIEDPSREIRQLGRKLIDDYNYCYLNIHKVYYINEKQIQLVKLEQLFIQNKISSCCIFEYSKPSASTKRNCDVFSWISKITNLRLEKVQLLKEYIDMYFQYLFDKPKNIWKINNLDLPLSLDERSYVNIKQYASFLNRKSTTVVESINDIKFVKNLEANDSFMSWFRSIPHDYKDLQKLTEYRSNIENLSENIVKLGEELVDNYHSDEVRSEKQQCLINLEQFLIRYNKSTNYVHECMKKKKNNYTLNQDVNDGIRVITSGGSRKNRKLKNYLNEYFCHIDPIEESKNSYLDWNSDS